MEETRFFLDKLLEQLFQIYLVSRLLISNKQLWVMFIRKSIRNLICNRIRSIIYFHQPFFFEVLMKCQGSAQISFCQVVGNSWINYSYNFTCAEILWMISSMESWRFPIILWHIVISMGVYILSLQVTLIIIWNASIWIQGMVHVTSFLSFCNSSFISSKWINCIFI